MPAENTEKRDAAGRRIWPILKVLRRTYPPPGESTEYVEHDPDQAQRRLNSGHFEGEAYGPVGPVMPLADAAEAVLAAEFNGRRPTLPSQAHFALLFDALEVLEQHGEVTDV